jgi:hypothetical protein
VPAVHDEERPPITAAKLMTAEELAELPEDG